MKYIIDKLEKNTHSLSVNKLGLLAFELMNGRDSDLIESFSEVSPDKICDILTFRKDEEVYKWINDAIKDKEFIHFLTIDCHRTGFLAELHIPILSKTKTDKNGLLESASYSQGLCHIDWVYGETIGELSDKIIEISDKWEKYDIKQNK